jgi:hypothetical protein
VVFATVPVVKLPGAILNTHYYHDEITATHDYLQNNTRIHPITYLYFKLGTKSFFNLLIRNVVSNSNAHIILKLHTEFGSSEFCNNFSEWCWKTPLCVGLHSKINQCHIKMRVWNHMLNFISGKEQDRAIMAWANWAQWGSTAALRIGFSDYQNKPINISSILPINIRFFQ